LLGEKPFFIWELEFGRVFKEKGGFDIVVGNPPYLRIQGIQQVDVSLAELYKNKFESATGSFDLYVSNVSLSNTFDNPLSAMRSRLLRFSMHLHSRHFVSPWSIKYTSPLLRHISQSSPVNLPTTLFR
jgi:hypothetical protein